MPTSRRILPLALVAALAVAAGCKSPGTTGKLGITPEQSVRQAPAKNR